jgi:hypothetical protein
MEKERLQIGYLEVENRPTVMGTGVLLSGEAAAVKFSNLQNSDIIIYNSGSGLWLNSGVNFGSFYAKDNPSGFVTNTNLQELQISLSTGIENYTGTFVTPFSSVPSVVATMLATQGFNYMAALTSVTTTNFVADFSDVIEETGVTLNIIAYN